jgi:hypothetical protein
VSCLFELYFTMAQSPEKPASPFFAAPSPASRVLSPSPLSPNGQAIMSPSNLNTMAGGLTLPTTTMLTPGSGNGLLNAAPTPSGTAVPMGPPTSVPQKDKKEESTDFTDILISTGIDIRDEESALTSSFFSSQARPGATSFTAHQDQSFGSRGSQEYLPQGASFSSARASQGLLNGNNSINGYPEFGSYDIKPTAEDLARQTETVEARRRAEQQSNFYQNSFLDTPALRQKVLGLLQKSNIAINRDERAGQGQSRYNTTTAASADGWSITAVQGGYQSTDNSLGDVLALISLSAADHFRTLAESALAFSIGRRTTSHGEIPDDYKDIAIDQLDLAASINGGSEPKLSMDSGSTIVNGKKRMYLFFETRIMDTKYLPPGSFMEMQNDQSSIEGPIQSSTPASYTARVTKALRDAARKEFEAEEARLARRMARQSTLPPTTTVTNGDSPTKTTSSSQPGTPSASGSSAPIGERAPEVDSKKGSKQTKEQRKQAESKADEARLHMSANSTASMMLGNRFGNKKKKYSWMTTSGGGNNAGGPGTPSIGPAASTVSTPGGLATGDPNAIPGSYAASKVHKIGDWREDSPNAVGIQMRDWIAAFEADGREKLSLLKAYARLK